MRRFIISCLFTCLSALGTAAEKTNVLLIMADDLNNDLGCYGHPKVKSPNIDRLASQGVRFERAYCQYPQCNASRASMMTGMYPDQTGVRDNHTFFRERRPEAVTLPQLFRNNGYFTARVGKIYHFGVPGEIGTNGMDDAASWDEVVNPRGRDKDDEALVHSIDPKHSMGGTLSWLAAGGEDAEQTDGIGASACIELLERNRGGPFFIAMGFYRPHTPYVAPKKYFRMYPVEELRSPAEPADGLLGLPMAAWMDRPYQLSMDELTKRQATQAYYASISFMDAQLGRILDALETLGLSRNTVVVFVSDHGYHMGEHMLWQKTTLFENSARVPLIIAAPAHRETAGGSTGALAEMLDIYPTLADLCGLRTPDAVQGLSLRPQLRDTTAEARRAALTTLDAADRTHRPKLWPDTRGFTIRTDRYRYTEWDGGKLGVELYDHEADPGEYVNLSLAPHMRETLRDLKQLLASKIGEATREP